MKLWTLMWRFKNDHVWYQVFETEDEAQHYVNICGLRTHPDIVEIEIRNTGERK